MKNSFLKIIYKVLAFYAKRVIVKYNPKIIAVTGSVGKTSTKEAIFTVLSSEFGSKVRKSEGNLNAEIGIPLTILGYKELPNKFLWPFFLIGAFFKVKQKKYPKYLILEMGVEKKGDLADFTNIARPDFAVITRVSVAHIANFSDEKEYQKEKLSIITAVKPDGKIFLNYDDPQLKNICGKRIVSVGVDNKNTNYRAEDIKTTLSGTEFRIACTGHKIAVKSPLVGTHLLNSLLFAFAVGDNLGISLIKVGNSLEKIKPYQGRMKIIPGKKKTIIIDDTYNASPSSVMAALKTLQEINHNGRKIAILGNMNELGKQEKNFHQEIGAYARGRCDFAIFVGPNAKSMRSSYGSQRSSLDFSDRKKLLAKLPYIINEKDLILVKASQNGNFFEEVVKTLMEKPGEAKDLLVRQSRFWLKKKFS